jgi:hypothetical protein
MTRTAARLALGTTISAVALATAVGPALAAKPAARPTSLTLKAAKSTVKPNQKDTLTGTLKSGNTPLAGKDIKLMKRDASKRTWTYVSTKTTDAKGHVTLVVTPGTHKGKKEQYELVFAGDAKDKASHSSVITLTVS